MKMDRYALESESCSTVFEFISEGKNGPIHKLIRFQKTNVPGLYNLAFGEKNADGGIDDLAVSNNGDREKVLATVGSALYKFFDRHPNALVYATGSTASRTRLYRMGITKFYKEIIADFQLFGQIGDDYYEFEIGKEYNGFLVLRKFN
jgi:hypothetical protein